MRAETPVSLTRLGEPCDYLRGADRAGKPGVHVDDLRCDGIDPLESLEAAEHDAVRRRPEQAADDLPRLLDDDERGVEAVEAWLDPEPAEQPEGEVVLGLVRPGTTPRARGTRRRR